MDEAAGAASLVICVAGMPRSGTSLVTQLLHRCGLSLGPAEQLMPANINNPDGYWENLRFVRVNERLLGASGGAWFAPPATLHPTADVTEEARSVVAQFDGSELWGWKDPRNALTLPFWRSLLPSMRVVVCIRHPAETAASLVASTLMPRTLPFYWAVTRSESTIRLQEGALRRPARVARAIRTSLSGERRRALIYEVGLELWRVSNERILDETRPEERIVTHYQAVLADPRKELERLTAFAGLRVSSADLDEIASVVSPAMRRQQKADVALPAAVEALYARLSREAGYESRQPSPQRGDA